MTDLTWAPQVVETVARAICEADSYAWDGVSKERYQKYLGMARAAINADAALALSASPLPEALALIKQFREFLLYCGAMDGATFDTARAQLTADATVFLARVRG